MAFLLTRCVRPDFCSPLARPVLTSTKRLTRKAWWETSCSQILIITNINKIKIRDLKTQKYHDLRVQVGAPLRIRNYGTY